MVKGLSLQGTGNKAFSIVALLVVIPAIALSILILIADRYAYLAETMLDDPQTEEKDALDIDEQSIPAYNKAISALDKARILAPLNSNYARSLTDLYSRINVWQETMKTMGVASLEGMPTGKELRDSRYHNAKKALILDPANADHFLALGQIYAADGVREAALDQLIKAINSYPINGAIRYAAAMQMLMMGMHEQAREQAKILARTDDSYRLDDDDPTTILIRERRPPGYEANLAKSYLYKAMEIIWRTSTRDPKAVHAIVPGNEDAQEVARMFFEQKGI